MPALHPPRLALLLLATALSCVSRTAAQQPPNDPLVMAALLAQRDAITNWEEFATANNITGWTADAPYCQWHKKTVQCIGQTGAINVDLGCLERGGTSDGFCAKPRALGTLAPELANIKKLKRLYLSGQSLSGSIPEEWSAPGAFPELVELWLAENTLLTGTLPARWGGPGQLAQLQYLYIGYNQFSGPLPDSWGKKGAFPALVELQASRNSLSGTLPVSWGTTGAFPSLETLNLNVNKWSGTLPASWGGRDKFPALSTLYISETPITGSLPDSWAGTDAFPNLADLRLATSALNGTLPSSWGSPTAFQKLAILYLDATGMSGTLPESWAAAGSFPALSELGLSHSQFTGTLPASWGSEVAWQQLGLLELESNQLSGTLPESWGQAGSFQLLYYMDLSNNRLGGTLPANYGSKDAFPQLEALNLQGNPLTGTIPESWGSAEAFPKLQKFNAAADTLCGKYPAGLADKVGESPLYCVPTEQAAAVPAAPPSTSPSPASPSPASPSWPAPEPVGGSSESSTNVGAIVGGVIGGLAAIAVIAFFALRPGKGFLRRKQPTSLGPRPSMSASAGRNFKGGPRNDGGGSLGSGSDTSEEMIKADAPLSERAAMNVPITPTSVSRTISRNSAPADPVLSYIAASLTASRPYKRSTSALSASSSLPDDISQWLVEWDEICLERCCGKGSFGWVYEAFWKQTPVAVKVLLTADALETGSGGLELPSNVMAQLQQEARVLTKMRHPNIVNFVGICPLPPCILTEFCSRGSLYNVLCKAVVDAAKAAELTWGLRMNMLVDAARGIVYLHSMKPPIIHRDIKSPNLLVDRSFVVKVADFNLSRVLQPAAFSTGTTEGIKNPIWQAPEVLQGAKETAASDIFSFSMVMLEMLTWEAPWSGTGDPGNYFQVARKVVAGQRPSIPLLSELPGPDRPSPHCYDAYCDLMRECWAHEPAARPHINEVAARLAFIAGTASSSEGLPAGMV